MAQVKAFKVDGVRMMIYSGDHNPPHFHASRPGEWSAKVYFQKPREAMFDNVKPKGAKIRPADRGAIVEGAEESRISLLREWEAAQTDSK